MSAYDRRLRIGETPRRATPLLLAALAVLALGPPARGQRPAAVAAEERRALDDEIEFMRRKNDALSHSLDQRTEDVRRRLRVLYKLAQGKYLRILVGAERAEDVFAQRTRLSHIVSRDLAEVQALGEELQELAVQRRRLRERERQVFEVEAAVPTPAAAAFPSHPGGLFPPVGGPIVGRFGTAQTQVRALVDAESIVQSDSSWPGRREVQTSFEAGRDGVLFAAAPGEPVYAIVAGTVLAVSVIPGIGLTVMIDHGGGWASLVGPIADPLVTVKDQVAAAAVLGSTASATLELQLMYGGTWVDPSPWLAR